MPQEHSSKDGPSRPPQRHDLEQGAEEQLEHFNEERRRQAKPRKLIRPSPPKQKAGEEKS